MLLSKSSSSENRVLFVTSKSFSKANKSLLQNSNEFEELYDTSSLFAVGDNLDNKVFLKQLKKLEKSILEEFTENPKLIDSILELKWPLRYKSKEILKFFSSLIIKLIGHDKILVYNNLNKIINLLKIDDHEAGNVEEYESYFSAVRKIFLNFQTQEKLIDNLVDEILSSYPKSVYKPKYHESYVYNLIKLTEIYPKKQYKILFGLFFGLMSIDINNKEEEELSYMDIIDDESNRNILLLQTQDLCMLQLYNFIKSRQNDIELFYDFCRIFDSIILTTKESHFLQFALFYMLALNRNFTEKFIQKMWTNIFDLNGNITTKQASASYLAGFLARANFATFNILKNVILELSNWIHCYILNIDTTNANNRSDVVFYSLCQALFYLIAFRHQEFINSNERLSFLKSLNLSKIITSTLNPLNHCSKAVVNLFGSIMRYYQIVYCYSVIEKNSCYQNQLINTIEKSKENFNFFFPFDSYCLKKSGEIIQPYYRSHHFNDNYDDFYEPMDIDVNTSTNSSSPTNSFLEISSYIKSPGFR